MLNAARVILALLPAVAPAQLVLRNEDMSFRFGMQGQF
jgi:hypothetical protein